MNTVSHWPTALALALLASFAHPSMALEYDCTALPVKGADPRAHVSKINIKRQIVGDSTFADGSAGAALWKGQQHKLVNLSRSLQDPISSGASSINDKGQVVGSAVYRCGEFCFRKAGLLWQDGVPVELMSLPDASGSIARSINNKGRIVGDMRLANAWHAVVWRDGQPFDLGALGSTPSQTASEAHFVNDSNVVVGTGQGGDGDYKWHALLWDAKGRLKDLGWLPGGDFAIAESVNRAGTVVGRGTGSGMPDSVSHAVAWENGTPIDLGTLTPGAFSNAWSINDSGVVVGGEDKAGYYKALVWPSIHEPPLELKTLVKDNCHVSGEFSLEDAVSINADGAIAAKGYQAGVGFVPFLLTPRRQ